MDKVSERTPPVQEEKPKFRSAADEAKNAPERVCPWPGWSAADFAAFEAAHGQE
jgi:hypothetical protein